MEDFCIPFWKLKDIYERFLKDFENIKKIEKIFIEIKKHSAINNRIDQIKMEKLIKRTFDKKYCIDSLFRLEHIKDDINRISANSSFLNNRIEQKDIKEKEQINEDIRNKEKYVFKLIKIIRSIQYERMCIDDILDFIKNPHIQSPESTNLIDMLPSPPKN